MFTFDDNRYRLFDELFRMMATPSAFTTRGAVYPAVNIYDDGESFLVRAEVAGIDKESLDITAKRDQLTVRGTRTLKPAEDNASWHRREREGGQFRRTVTLPQPIDAEKVVATYKDGVLEIVLPRAAEAKQRRIPVM
ncbi:Hsp20/alpha crystallin family protein [Myxococcota bacterium]|nr:Hsp20/alpha crystallin family protein [Myxococcota bacterium]